MLQHELRPETERNSGMSGRCNADLQRPPMAVHLSVSAIEQKADEQAAMEAEDNSSYSSSSDEAQEGYDC